MRNHLTALLKSISLGIALVALLTLSQGVARADEVTVSGFSTGTVTGVPQLTFAGNSFTGTTALGVGSLSGANRLGTFTLATGPLQAVAGNFTMNVTFTAPTGIAGGQGTSYTATISGSVSPNVGQGGVDIIFNNPTQTFTFNNGTTSGSFTLTVANLFVQSGQSANLTGGIRGSQSPIPEPATMFLLGTGLAGVAAKIRKRRKPAEE
ncbi:MAG TPA: PEP-CTERM sorting domain-containing protein [Pyrinomonadaceae bacterium]|nr:PEP-CTERM sorting domain-containing protein [Pyrinomonadaceae bacterium]